MAATLFIGLFIGIFVVDFSFNSADKLTLEQHQAHLNDRNNDIHSVLNINIDGLKSGFTRMALITELTTKLDDWPDASRYNISIGKDKFPLIIATEFIDSKGRECKIINSKIKGIHYISACQNDNGEWDIQFID